MTDLEAPFLRILRAQSPAQVDFVLEELAGKIQWLPLGENPENYGVIAMGSDPFDGVVERITNAMDALVELEVELHPDRRTCRTPREAVQSLFGLPGGHLLDLPDENLRQLANRIQVRFCDSGNPKKPSIEIRDQGIGRSPKEFPSTLLSLNRGNKVTKFYLMGAFGHGGQTSFAQAEYGILISRKDPRLLRDGQADSVGWTVVRYHDPTTATEFHKQGRWEYCVLKDGGTVPEAPPTCLPFVLDQGTIVRLVAYDLPRGGSDVLQPTGQAWSFLSQSLFDPILPIRLFESRERYEQKDASISGLARRLSRGGRGEKVKLWASDSYLLDLGSVGIVRINYWALEPASESERWAEIRRTYVGQGQAVFFTLNGQRHDVEPPTFLRDRVKLEYANPYVIVQVDCDDLSKDSKKRLFPSTRQRLIEGELKEQLLQEVVDHLRADRNLLAFEENRMTRITAHKSSVDTSKIRRMVAQYVAQDPELKSLIKSETRLPGEGSRRPTPERNEDSTADEPRPEELAPPEVHDPPTFLKISNARDPISVEKGGAAQVRLETDAPDSYLEGPNQVRFRALHGRGLTQLKSVSQLHRGKLSYQIRCPESVRVGSHEPLTFELGLPDGTKLIASREIECIHPIERRKEPVRSKIPEPNIIGITQAEHGDLWRAFSWTKRSVGRVYLAQGDTAQSGIYVSLDNDHLTGVLRQRGKERDIAELIRNRYLAGVAYYLILRKAHELKHKLPPPTPEEDPDSSSELDRLAQTLAAVAVPLERFPGE